MAEHLDGKVICITGAGSGFGRLVAYLAGAGGAHIVATDIDGAAARETAAAVEAAGGQAIGVTADVCSRVDLTRAVQAGIEQFGSLDVMVNNAGVMPLAFFADHAAAADAWDRCIDINLKGVLNGIIAAHDPMIQQGRGHVVNISSIYGNYANAGAAVYTATKAAVNVLSETLRVESQGKIKVTTVKPTGVPGTGLGAGVINPEAIAGIVGHHGTTFFPNLMAYLSGALPPAQTDIDSIGYWTISPEDLARQIIYVIDQPWGVTISDITVRAAGEEYVL